MIPEYRIGQRFVLVMSFYNDATPPVLTDPTTVALVITKPDGTELTANNPPGDGIVKDSVGVYHYPYVMDQIGDYGWEAEGNGAVQARLRGVFVGQA